MSLIKSEIIKTFSTKSEAVNVFRKEQWSDDVDKQVQEQFGIESNGWDETINTLIENGGNLGFTTDDYTISIVDEFTLDSYGFIQLVIIHKNTNTKYEYKTNME